MNSATRSPCASVISTSKSAPSFPSLMSRLRPEESQGCEFDHGCVDASEQRLEQKLVDSSGIVPVVIDHHLVPKVSRVNLNDCIRLSQHTSCQKRGSRSWHSNSTIIGLERRCMTLTIRNVDLGCTCAAIEILLSR